jgi:kinetochore protein NNF1
VQQLQTFFERRAHEEFGAILQERQVVAGLNGLDKVLEEAARRSKEATATASERAAEKGAGFGLAEQNGQEQKTAAAATAAAVPPHQLPPQKITAAHLAPHYRAAQVKLNARLQNAQMVNLQLISALEEDHRTVDGIVGVLEGVVRDLEGSSGEIEAGDV